MYHTPDAAVLTVWKTLRSGWSRITIPTIQGQWVCISCMVGCFIREEKKANFRNQ